MEGKKLSVIVCAYNQEKYIKECLNSLVNQSYQDMEIIVINDGSTDATGDLIKSVMTENCNHNIVLIDGPNRGLSDSRNIGFSKSTGEYIAFVDADDYVDERMYEKMIHALEKYEADVSICYEIAFIDGKALAMADLDIASDRVENREEFFQHFLDPFRGPLTWVWNKVFKRELLENVGFMKNRYLEDIIYTVDYSKYVHKAVWIPERLYYYRQHQNSIMHSNGVKKELDYLYAIDYEASELKGLLHDEFDRLHIEKCLGIIHHIGKECRKNHEKGGVQEAQTVYKKLYSGMKCNIVKRFKYYLMMHMI